MRYKLILTALAVLTMQACTNVAQMQKKYEQGDERQFRKIVEILARTDYPYATRKRAAKALGEIGELRAVPVLISVLSGFDQRTTLKQEALIALGKIGDTTAVAPISRLLDRSMQETNAELRLAAIPVLGQLGGDRAALVLIRALRLYDFQILQRESRVARGMFSDEEQPQFNNPYTRIDSTGRFSDQPSIGGFPGQQSGPVNMFGLDPRATTRNLYDPTPEERRLTHETLVNMVEGAVPAIERFLEEEQMTHTLERELQGILEEIRQQGLTDLQTPLETPQAAQ